MTYKDLTEEEFEEIVEYGDENYAAMNSPSITGKSRWSYSLEQVFKHIPTSKYYKIKWSEAATEYQDQDFGATIAEVEPVSVTITEYKEVR